MKGKKENRSTEYIAFFIPGVLECIQSANLTTPSDTSVRELVQKVQGATTDFKSTFVGCPKRIVCSRVPRHALSKETLSQIDKSTYLHVVLK